MSAPRWVRRPLDDSYYYALWLSEWEEYVIDATPTGFQAMHNVRGEDRNVGPHRKTLKAARNDCIRSIRKDRARLLVASRAKL